MLRLVLPKDWTVASEAGVAPCLCSTSWIIKVLRRSSRTTHKRRQTVKNIRTHFDQIKSGKIGLSSLLCESREAEETVETVLSKLSLLPRLKVHLNHAQMLTRLNHPKWLIAEVHSILKKGPDGPIWSDKLEFNIQLHRHKRKTSEFRSLNQMTTKKKTVKALVEWSQYQQQS